MPKRPKAPKTETTTIHVRLPLSIAAKLEEYAETVPFRTVADLLVSIAADYVREEENRLKEHPATKLDLSGF